VTWDCDGRHGRLVVADDGAGFDPAGLISARTAGGSGLTAMRERANAIGARLLVDSQPGSGTWIRIELDTGKEPAA
jgi:signal transduction histidine kinase